MTASVAAAPPRPPATGRTVLRLHRAALIVWVLVTVAAALALLWAYGPGAESAEAAWRRSCPVGDDCMWDTTLNGYYRTVMLARWAIVYMPYVVAAWAGAVVGRELESGTARLAWTQGVTPTRWLAAKLAVPAALLTAGTAVLVLLHRMVYRANEFPLDWVWYDDNTFTANGTLALALPLLALAVGALAGLLLRRALPALAVGLAVTVLVEYAADTVTPHLWPWQTALNGLRSGPGTPQNVLWGDQGALTATGERIPIPDCGDSMKCFTDHGVTGYYLDYHPASDFWPLQYVETGLLLAIAAAATAAAFLLLHRRTA
ncbi:hypothetical protein ABZ835_15540 [Streptomyces sp. NPDC047461]|uniref:hypothetical protein n=1 Tax=Streptomyces sp. NPDC047461 TaxID=3155619 RepID=UPI0033C81F3D